MQPSTLFGSRFSEEDPHFSPDGRAMTFISNESGRFEIYVQSFPDPTTKTQISANGGAQLRWRRDGRELFYIAADGHLMAVPVLNASGSAFQTGLPVALFVPHIGGAITGPQKQQYDVSPDGQRFFMNTLIQGPSPPISIVFHWPGI